MGRGEQDGVLEGPEVVRVDQQRLAEFGRRVGELAEHGCSPVIGPAGDVLFGDEVHAVGERSDDHDVRGGVEPMRG
jgi:hypothetical protein